MPVQVRIPTRIRVDARALTERRECLEEALETAAARALANSREVVLRERGGYARVCLGAPEFTWRGDGLHAVPRSQRAEIEARLARALRRAVEGAGLLETAVDGREVPEPLPPDPAERADRLRLTRHRYTIPEYEDAGRPVDVPLARDPFSAPPGADLALPDPQPPIDAVDVARRLASSNVSERSIALADVLDEFYAGDDTALVLVLRAIRPDGSPPTEAALSALADLARKDARKFRERLRALLKTRASQIAASLMRAQTQLYLDVSLFPDLDLAAAIVTVARRIPEAAALLKEWEEASRGTRALLDLVEAVIAVRRDLIRYLEASSESKAELPVITAITNGYRRISGIFAILAGNAYGRSLLYDLQRDLIENYAWIAGTLEHVRQIDDFISLFRLIYGEQTLDQLEEVWALRETRSQLLRQIVDFSFPDAAIAADLKTDAQTAFDGWPARAADRKWENVRKALDELGTRLRGLHESAHYGYYSPEDHRYNRHLRQTRDFFASLEKELGITQAQPRGVAYLSAVSAVEEQLSLLLVRLSLVSVWQGARDLTDPIRYPNDLGTRAMRKDWFDRIYAIEAALEREFPNPDFNTIGSRLETWVHQLEAIQGEMQRRARREFWINLGITLVAVVVTLGVGGGLAVLRAGTLVTLLAEAAAFTTVHLAGQALVLDKSIGPGEVVEEFTTNVALFGAFRVLGAGLSAGAKALFPQKALAQLVFIFGSTAVIGTGVPVLLSTLEAGELPEGTETFVVASLMLHAIVALIAGPKALEVLRREAQTETLARLMTLHEEQLLLRAEMEAILKAGGPSKEQFASAQSRQARIYRELEAVCKRMASADFSDDLLAQLGLTRGQVKEMQELAARFAEAVAAAEWAPTVKLLPPPDAVLGSGLVPVGARSYEYNPFDPSLGRTHLMSRLTKAGYRVTDEGSGILLLQGPAGTAPYRLLPGRALLLPPALDEVAEASPRTYSRQGLQILRQQSAVPELELRLITAASTDRESTRLILAGIRRYLQASHADQFRGLLHYLDAGGTPKTLARLLDTTSTYGGLSVRAMLARLRDLTPEDVKTIELIAKLRGRQTVVSVTTILTGYDARTGREILRWIREVEPHTTGGLDGVITYLGSPSANLKIAGLASLRAAFDLLKTYPGATVRFEEPVSGPGGLAREVDVRLNLPSLEPLGYLRVEIKEVVDITILETGKAVHQFSKDLRIHAADPPPKPFRTLARLKWFIRWPSHPDGTRYSQTELQPVRDELRRILRQAFDRPEILSRPDRTALLDEFEKFFDEIVQFF